MYFVYMTNETNPATTLQPGNHLHGEHMTNQATHANEHRHNIGQDICFSDGLDPEFLCDEPAEDADQ